MGEHGADTMLRKVGVGAAETRALAQPRAHTGGLAILCNLHRSKQTWPYVRLIYPLSINCLIKRLPIPFKSEKWQSCRKNCRHVAILL